jgi:HAD superfamily hydrolase (TIGR01509 family)
LIRTVFVDKTISSVRVEAILWDNDGVLVDTEHIYFDVTRRVLGEIGVDLDEASYREFFLNASSGAWHLAADRGFSKEEVEALRARRNHFYAEALEHADVTLDGAQDVLEALKGVFRMAVVTSSRQIPFQIIHKRTGFMRFFEFALTREDYERSKPDPEPFLAATKRMQVDPARCLVIEDSPRGLHAAVAAGIPCWVIPNGLTMEGDFSAADRVLNSIREVPRLLGVRT